MVRESDTRDACSVMVCEQCTILRATLYCQDCQMALCADQCDGYLHQPRARQHHQRRALDDPIMPCDEDETKPVLAKQKGSKTDILQDRKYVGDEFQTGDGAVVLSVATAARLQQHNSMSVKDASSIKYYGGHQRLSTPLLCDLCEKASAIAFCPDCDMHLCELQGCIQGIHKPMYVHSRRVHVLGRQRLFRMPLLHFIYHILIANPL